MLTIWTMWSAPMLMKIMLGGLAGAFNYAKVGTAFAPVTSYDSQAFLNFATYLNKQGVSIIVPSPGDTFNLGRAFVAILGPIPSSDELNNTSIVLRIVYGYTSFLFTGDAEREEEQSILDTVFVPKLSIRNTKYGIPSQEARHLSKRRLLFCTYRFLSLTHSIPPVLFRYIPPSRLELLSAILLPSQLQVFQLPSLAVFLPIEVRITADSLCCAKFFYGLPTLHFRLYHLSPLR